MVIALVTIGLSEHSDLTPIEHQGRLLLPQGNSVDIAVRPKFVLSACLHPFLVMGDLIVGLQIGQPLIEGWMGGGQTAKNEVDLMVNAGLTHGLTTPRRWHGEVSRAQYFG
jgi:hypothetical protein